MTRKFNYNGFTYTDTNVSQGNSLNVEYNKEKPENLFKFFGLNKNSVSSLTENYLYAPHFFELNDYLDGSILFLKSSKPIPFRYYKKFLGSFSGENKIEDEKIMRAYYKEDIKTNSSGFLGLYWHSISNKLGVISTTSKENNILMWPHYTNERGFQLKFKTNTLEKSIESKMPGQYIGLCPINYCDELVQLDLKEIDSIFIPMLYCSTVKSRLWEYENEWRFIVSNKDMGIPFSKSGLDPRSDIPQNNSSRRIYYDPNSIEGITFGTNFIIGEDFIIDRPRTNGVVDDKSIVRVREGGNAQLIKELLDYCFEFLPDRIFLSSHNINSIGNKGKIIRTKERVILKKVRADQYSLERTHDMRAL